MQATAKRIACTICLSMGGLTVDCQAAWDARRNELMFAQSLKCRDLSTPNNQQCNFGADDGEQKGKEKPLRALVQPVPISGLAIGLDAL